MLKQLVIWANKLDKLGHSKLADEIDVFIKNAQLFDSKVNQNDFAHAVEFYNNVNVNEINPETLVQQDITLMEPSDFIPGLDTSDKGWLKDYPQEDWARLLTEKHGRNFTHIINMYKVEKMNPAIQINGTFADGLARAIFYNALGQEMPVVSFTSN